MFCVRTLDHVVGRTALKRVYVLHFAGAVCRADLDALFLDKLGGYVALMDVKLEHVLLFSRQDVALLETDYLFDNFRFDTLLGFLKGFRRLNYRFNFVACFRVLNWKLGC